MACSKSPYVEERNGGLYVAGPGVSIDSVVIRFQPGADPDKMFVRFRLSDYRKRMTRSLFARLEATRRNLISKRP